MARKSILATVAVVIAAIGALLVFMYARGADARASADVAEEQVLISTEKLAVGESVKDAIAAGKFELTEVPSSAVLPGALTETADLADQVATATIYPGEQLVSQKFGSAGSSTSLPIAKSEMAISLPLTDPDRVIDFVSPGASVAVYFTETDPANPSTGLVLEEVTVLAIGQSTNSTSVTEPDTEPEAAPAEETDTVIVTISVDQEEASKVIYASKQGEATFALLTDESVTGPAETIDPSNIFQ